MTVATTATTIFDQKVNVGGLNTSHSEQERSGRSGLLCHERNETLLNFENHLLDTVDTYVENDLARTLVQDQVICRTGESNFIVKVNSDNIIVTYSNNHYIKLGYAGRLNMKIFNENEKDSGNPVIRAEITTHPGNVESAITSIIENGVDVIKGDGPLEKITLLLTMEVIKGTAGWKINTKQYKYYEKGTL